MKSIILLAIYSVLSNLAMAFVLSIFSEKFLTKVALYALKKLVKSTKNELDDELVEEVEKRLTSKQ